MNTQPLAPDLLTAVLKKFQLPRKEPDERYLDQIIRGYVRQVPWESASRIVRKSVAAAGSRPRWPDEFWQENLARGCGGTCFESNYAIFSLLLGLGYNGYLTINDMGDSTGCHTAVMIQIERKKWLVDAGYPLFIPLPISPLKVTYHHSPYLDYTVRPAGPGRFQIEQEPHPNQVAFTLIDKPVIDANYREATQADYGETGLFLDAVIINKVVDGRPWRFNGREFPWAFNRFENGRRTDYILDGDPATAVARKFKIDVEVIQQAFSLTRPPSPPPAGQSQTETK